jgi:hypothetical protein
MVEGIVQDLSHAKVPNIPAERGWPAGWRHNKSGMLLKGAGAVALVALAAGLARRRRR